MPIPYALFKNNLTPDPTDYAAVVQNYRSADFEEIAERIIGQGSTVLAEEKTSQRAAGAGY